MANARVDGQTTSLRGATASTVMKRYKINHHDIPVTASLIHVKNAGRESDYSRPEFATGFSLDVRSGCGRNVRGILLLGMPRSKATF